MRRFSLLLIFMAFAATGLQAQSSCCTAGDRAQAAAQVSFASLGNDPAFRMQHELPAPFVLRDERWQNITYRTPDGDSAQAWLLPADEPSQDYLFLFHEWWGLNDYVKAEAVSYHDTLAGRVNMLCLDLYDGQVAKTREQAKAYMQSVTQARAEAIIAGARDHVGQSARVATIGWCFGGGWSLKASLLLDQQAAGCVMYYGMPVQDPEVLSGLHTDVLGIFAKQDGWITPKVVNEFEKNMAAANKQVRVKFFDAKHAFANPSSPLHDAEAAQQAFLLSSGFLRQAFDLN